MNLKTLKFDFGTLQYAFSNRGSSLHLFMKFDWDPKKESFKHYDINAKIYCNEIDKYIKFSKIRVAPSTLKIFKEINPYNMKEFNPNMTSNGNLIHLQLSYAPISKKYFQKQPCMPAKDQLFIEITPIQKSGLIVTCRFSFYAGSKQNNKEVLYFRNLFTQNGSGKRKRIQQNETESNDKASIEKVPEEEVVEKVPEQEVVEKVPEQEVVEKVPEEDVDQLFKKFRTMINGTNEEMANLRNQEVQLVQQLDQVRREIHGIVQKKEESVQFQNKMIEQIQKFIH